MFLRFHNNFTKDQNTTETIPSAIVDSHFQFAFMCINYVQCAIGISLSATFLYVIYQRSSYFRNLTPTLIYLLDSFTGDFLYFCTILSALFYETVVDPTWVIGINQKLLPPTHWLYKIDNCINYAITLHSVLMYTFLSLRRYCNILT
jgi:hypothetical protein